MIAGLQPGDHLVFLGQSLRWQRPVREDLRQLGRVGVGDDQAVGEKGLIVLGVGRAGAVFRTLNKCPACEAEAAALFLEAPADSLLFEMELAAVGLRCGLCGFHLTGEQEIKAAGLPSRVRYAVEDLTRVMHDSPLAATDAELLGSLPVAQQTNWPRCPSSDTSRKVGRG